MHSPPIYITTPPTLPTYIRAQRLHQLRHFRSFVAPYTVQSFFCTRHSLHLFIPSWPKPRSWTRLRRSRAPTASRRLRRIPRPQRSKFLSWNPRLGVVLYVCVPNAIALSYIQSQLQLEADAREALPYVSAGVKSEYLSHIILTSDSNSTHALALLELFDSLSSPALRAIPHRLRRPLHIHPRGYATRVPSHVTESTRLSNSFRSATLFAIVEPRASRIPVPARYG